MLHRVSDFYGSFLANVTNRNHISCLEIKMRGNDKPLLIHRVARELAECALHLLCVQKLRREQDGRH